MNHSEPQPIRPGADWVERIRGGDREAFGALFRIYYPGLCAMVDRRVGSPEVAEELVQDVFVRVWERRELLDPNGPIERYLFRAARNHALNHLKRRGLAERWKAVGSNFAGTIAGPDEEVRMDELQRATDDALRSLSPRCRQVFLLSREGHLTYAQIAEMLNVSIKTVEAQMGRALKELRTRLLPFLT